MSSSVLALDLDVTKAGVALPSGRTITLQVEPTPEQVAYWAERDRCEQRHVVMGGPEEGPEVYPCPCLVANDAGVVHVALRLDEIEVAALAQGATLWLTTWGVLPIHCVTAEDCALCGGIEPPCPYHGGAES